MNDVLTAKDRMHGWLVFYAITSANALNWHGSVDGPTYWKATTIALAMLILGAGMTGIVTIWTATAVAKTQAVEKKQ